MRGRQTVLNILSNLQKRNHLDDDDDDEYDNFYGAITQHMPLQGRLDKKPIVHVCQRYDFSK